MIVCCYSVFYCKKNKTIETPNQILLNISLAHSAWKPAQRKEVLILVVSCGADDEIVINCRITSTSVEEMQNSNILLLSTHHRGNMNSVFLRKVP